MILPTLISLGFLALLAAVCLYASFSIRSSIYGKIYWRGRTDRKQIALTFDDGPHPKYTREILNILWHEEVAATFFLVGKKIQAFPEVAQEIKSSGHELAFHGYTHRALWMKSRRTLQDEVDKSREVFRRVLGFEPKLFRPPYGIRGRSIMRMAARNGWKTILWTRAGWDWTEISGAEVARRALRKPQAGSILLLHDSNGPSLEADRSRTVEALQIIIKNLKQQGFTFVRISEICSD